MNDTQNNSRRAFFAGAIKKLNLFSQLFSTALLFAVYCLFSGAAQAQNTAFTYQGRLAENNVAVNGGYDMQFRLYDNPNAGEGTQQGATVSKPNTQVSNGLFTVELDFGSAVFALGGELFLEINIRPSGSQGGYTGLAPRQRLTSAPYSIRSKTAAAADGLSSACVGCVQNAQINSIDAAKINGAVANAATAQNVSGIVPVDKGGTGSATKNFVDLASDQTINGSKTFNGTISAGHFSGDGSGLTGIAKISSFGGQVANIAPNSQTYVFIGGTTTVTANANQRITASGSAALATSAGSAGIVFHVCYQWNNTAIQPLSNNFLEVIVTGNRTTFAATDSRTIVSTPGTYTIGLCVNNNSSTGINNNNYSAGWAMVTNN